MGQLIRSAALLFFLIISSATADKLLKTRTKRSFFSSLCPSVSDASTFEDGVRFILYTTSDPEVILATDAGTNISASRFNPTNPTKIIVHGFNSSPDLYALRDIRNEYLTQGFNNVIAVDWEVFASGCYPRVADYTVPVAARVAQLIKRLWDYGAEDIHAIGFSLGAHIPGIAANYLPKKIRRITGLDPAMPLFWPNVHPDSKLDAGDAEFVDVYHTDQFLQGTPERCGHVDFLMNFGSSQPDCSSSACSHIRAAVYFAESINSYVGFWAYPCPVWWANTLGKCMKPSKPYTLAGNGVSKYARGYKIVRTNNFAPFAKSILE